MQGIGTAAVFLGSMVFMIKSASDAGLPESEQTKGMISGLWIVAMCGGAYAGTSLGGLAYDKVGFRQGTLIECWVMSSSLVFILAFVVLRGKRNKSRTNYTELTNQ